MIEKRRRMRGQMPKAKLKEIHLEKCQLLPDRERLLELMPKGATVAEVGVADGTFSKMILEKTRPSRLILIDAWHTTRYAPDERMVREAFETPDLAQVVDIRKGLSTDVLSTFPDASFDWIYIDTNHAYETTRDELLLAQRLVKPGGRILGHDYCLGNIVKPAVFGVIPAVNEFCVTQDWQFEYFTLETNGFHSFCLRRI
jgi:predicted O-methyltransferase YrrM